MRLEPLLGRPRRPLLTAARAAANPTPSRPCRRRGGDGAVRHDHARATATRKAMPFATVDQARGRVAVDAVSAISSSRPGLGAILAAGNECATSSRSAGPGSPPISSNGVPPSALLMLAHAFDRRGSVASSLRRTPRRRSAPAILSSGPASTRSCAPAANHDGTIRDTACFSILDREWPNVRANLELRRAKDADEVIHIQAT